MNYVLIKLTTGEQLMATLEAQDETHVAISHPMVLRMIPQAIDGRISEHVSASPFCHFAEGKDFVLPLSSIMFIKPLKQSIVPHYENVVREHEEDVLVPADKRRVRWAGEEEEMTLEEINNRIEMLQAIIDGNADEKEVDEELEKNYIEGNDTVH